MKKLIAFTCVVIIFFSTALLMEKTIRSFFDYLKAIVPSGGYFADATIAVLDQASAWCVLLIVLVIALLMIDLILR